MKRSLVAFILLILLCSHDLFLKPDQYYCDPHSINTLALFNGTFFTSENIITRDRIKDVQVVGPDYVFDKSLATWLDWDQKTLLKVETGQSGTYVAGISIHPRTLELSADEFDEYLEHDGVVDILKERKEAKHNAGNVMEQYAKHVKCIFQVGEKRTTDFNRVFNYPVEFVALTNPGNISTAGVMDVRLLRFGTPFPDQMVYLGVPQHDTPHQEDGHAHQEKSYRTDQNGMVRIHLDHPGEYYLRTIHMVKSHTDNIDYESNWATLSFEIR